MTEILPPPIVPISEEDELWLRAVSIADNPELVEIATKVDPKLGQYQYWARPDHLHDISSFTQDMVNGMQDGTELQYRIVQAAHRDLVPKAPIIGSVSLYASEGQPKAKYLGYWVVPEARGKGIAYRAAQRVVRLAVERGMVTDEIGLEITDTNIPSVRLARRLGAKQTYERYNYRIGNTNEIVPLRKWVLKV